MNVFLTCLVIMNHHQKWGWDYPDEPKQPRFRKVNLTWQSFLMKTRVKGADKDGVLWSCASLFALIVIMDESEIPALFLQAWMMTPSVSVIHLHGSRFVFIRTLGGPRNLPLNRYPMWTLRNYDILERFIISPVAYIEKLRQAVK